ncbi:phosphate/phosphite/phosphonate ABC transporter substrate-binding protein [Halostella sp. JP-L12]|uniref:phosphate/phosphite/phosphonate ABC transporter substrate-binding protein n=1 Tax=Halostella TaxID=1843185 RepID=UPI000EF7A60E|nr:MULTISPECIES: phosphate/phosphite/phosphonate ABC transporter substrate-binding protein [Halostella]NHN49085.1 phosphate/phosphite/phosphonate ABC transporter substrate-binding protein [Halostella sp. JP-L12]
MARTRYPTSRRSYLAAVGGTLLTGGCLGRSSTPTIRMGVVPDVDPDTAISQNTGLADYLESRLDATVDLSTSADYAGMVRSMAAEQVDLAYFGGVSYVLAHHRAGAEPVAVGARNGSTEWRSAFVAHASTDLSSLSDAAAAPGDYDLVFGDPISTSGTVMPTYYLRTEYDTAPEDFGSTTHVGAHDATAKAIGNGSGDVGALNARIYDALVERGDVGNEVVELWRTPGFPDYPWAVAPSVDAERTRRIREAFTELDDRDRTAILDEQNVDEYVPASHDDFASLNEGVEMAGLLDEDGGEGR